MIANDDDDGDHRMKESIGLLMSFPMMDDHHRVRMLLQLRERMDGIKLQPSLPVALLHVRHDWDPLKTTFLISLFLSIADEKSCLQGLCASGLARKALVEDAGGGGGGGMICGGEEYSNAYEGRRPSLRLPSRTHNALSLTFRRSPSLSPIAACSSPGELNCNFSHSYGYKYFMYLKNREKDKMSDGRQM